MVKFMRSKTGRPDKKTHSSKLDLLDLSFKVNYKGYHDKSMTHLNLDDKSKKF